MTEQLFFKISKVMDNYADLKFDEWVKNSAESQKELSETKKLCSILKEIHNEISQSLGAEKTVIDEADIHQEYENSRIRLIDQANDAYKKSNSLAFWEKLIGVFDIFDFVARKAADCKMVYLTTVLQLALDYFTGYLATMHTFITSCHTNVSKMIDSGNDLERASERELQSIHFKKMKARAGEIRHLCNGFVNTASQKLRNNLSNLPRHDDDEAFLNDWKKTIQNKYGLTQTQINTTR